jgi:hypothetical protein
MICSAASFEPGTPSHTYAALSLARGDFPSSFDQIPEHRVVFGRPGWPGLRRPAGLLETLMFVKVREQSVSPFLHRFTTVVDDQEKVDGLAH